MVQGIKRNRFLKQLICNIILPLSPESFSSEVVVVASAFITNTSSLLLLDFLLFESGEDPDPVLGGFQTSGLWERLDDPELEPSLTWV
jgi:hypothetical protein